jgi:RimJ/RimL family protein N-acetyltransferase
MFGNTIKVEGNGLCLILRQPRENDIPKMIKGLSDWEVGKYLGAIRGGVTQEQKEEWLQKVQKDDNGLTWFIQPEQSEIAIGNTSIHGFRDLNNSCSTGCAIWDKKEWGNGIASLAHIARTWFAARQLGVYTINSSVYAPNVGSWKALERVGYIKTGIRPRCRFVDGKYTDMYLYTWTHPDRVSTLYPEGLPKEYTEKEKKNFKDGIEKARITLEKGDKYVKYV